MAESFEGNENGFEEDFEETMVEEFRQRFQLSDKVIGRGAFSVVKLGQEVETKRNCAIKVTDLLKLQENLDLNAGDLLHEAEIHLQLKHPYIVEMIDSYYMSGKMFMIFEHMEGEDICYEITSRANDGYSYCESVISYFMKLILEAVNYCHERNIVHRDIKPQNILMAFQNTKSPVKLNDFGIAVQLKDDELCTPGRIGTPHFMAPEVVLRLSYGKEVDIWSVGVLFFLLLGGTLPFNGSGDALYETIECGIPENNAPVWDIISDDAKDLLSCLLKYDTNERVTAAEALQHPFIRNFKNCSKTHLQESVNEMIKFNNSRRFKKYVSNAVSVKTGAVEDKEDENKYQVNCSIDTMTVSELSENLFESLAEIHQLSGASIENFSVLKSVLSNPQIKAYLKIYDKLHEPLTVEENIDKGDVISKVMEDCNGSQVEVPEKDELLKILSKPHFSGLLWCMDKISNNYDSDADLPQNNSTVSFDDSDKIFVRLVEFDKSPNTRLGMTVKMREDKRCHVVRVMHNGFIHQQGTIHIGDEIIEINGIVVSHLTPSKLRQIMLSLSGKVSFKIIPTTRQSPQSVQCYLKSQFTYNGDNDDSMPCQHLGLSFTIGNILEVVNTDDTKWWQARHINNPESVGLIPCPDLREWTYCRPTSKKNSHSWLNNFLNKKKHSKETYEADRSSDFDVFDIPSYEEVMQVNLCKRKTIVLLGANGVGKRQVKTQLIKSSPIKFASPAIDTTRLPRMGETPGKNFNFLSKPDMLRKIEDREYLEYRSFEVEKNQVEYFGISYDAVRTVHEDGKIAVIDVEPSALKVLRNKEFLPYVVFISPPSFDQLGSLCDVSVFSKKGKSDEMITRIIRDSQKIESQFQHYFDLILHHENVEATVSELISAVDQTQITPQWIPVSWIY
ncbi:Peripheral plasma membrane protein CASK [Trichoplax sp. H2]|nr:Peripheral plasma membrane protein CASK [Trichoplax sp. H2]|eukprot:RDD46096.1 Peripheral plasma membrane protein CASK [Trichoplax sp. H2]